MLGTENYYSIHLLITLRMIDSDIEEDSVKEGEALFAVSITGSAQMIEASHHLRQQA